MRQVVNKLALNGGKTHRQICREFSINELMELVVYEKVKFQEQSKEDIRHGLLMSMVASIGGSKHDVKKFIPNWNGKREIETMSKEEICNRSKSHWSGMIAMNQQVNKKVNRNG